MHIELYVCMYFIACYYELLMLIYINCNIDIFYKCMDIDCWFYMNCNIDNCEWTWINIYLTTNSKYFSFVFKYSKRISLQCYYITKIAISETAM